MAVAGGAAEGQCTAEEEAENREQQTNEMDMIQSIFEGQFVLLGHNTEYMVNTFTCHDGNQDNLIRRGGHTQQFFLARVPL